MANRSQPPSFKTDVNRAKTKKWIDAKSPSYDDWPDDEEYGDEPYNEPPIPAIPKPTGLRQRGQGMPTSIDRGRNMTEPLAQNPVMARERSGSFETGDDRRDFSSSSAPFPSYSHVQSSIPPIQPDVSASTVIGSGSQPDASFPPPRKSSLSQQQRPDMSYADSGQATSQQPPPPAEEEEVASPKTFIRPADIYRRMEAEKERERQSLDSNRPSMDAVGANSAPHESTMASSYLKPSLPPVAERRSEYIVDATPRESVDSQQSDAPTVGAPPLLPSFGRFSTFGTDLWSGDSFAEDPSTSTSMVSENQTTTSEQSQQNLSTESSANNLQHQPSGGFQTVVRDAFHGNNIDNSTLSPTSARGSQSSKDGSGVSRSNTDSTAGISPILSGAPSGANIARRGQENPSQTSPILEEPQMPSSDSRRGSGTTTRGTSYDDSQTTPIHSRNISSDSATTTKPPVTSAYQANFNAGSGRSSPAHAPMIETRNLVPEPSAAEMAAATPSDSSLQHTPVHDENQTTPKTATAGLNRYSDREADLAAKMGTNPEEASSLGEAAQSAQSDFLQRDSMPAPLTTQGLSQSTGPSSGRDSPSKGRVRDLATRYNGITDRSATASPTGSVASWASSNQQTGSPNKATDPQSGIEGSDDSSSLLTAPLRPRLPGEWVSETPQNREVEAEAPEPGLQKAPTSSSRYESNPATPQDAYATHSKEEDRDENEVPDFSPNPSRNTTNDKTQDSTGTLAAVAAAGAAVGASITAAVGLSKSDDDDEDGDREVDAQESTMHRNTSHMSVEPQPEDLESDRLRKDIVRTLTPDKAEDAASPTLGGFLSTGEAKSTQPRESTMSSVLPREYDSYWGMSGTQSQNQSPSLISQPFDQPKATTPTSGSRPKFLKNRFSWETTEETEEDTPAAVAASSLTEPDSQHDRSLSQSNDRLKGLDNLSKLETAMPDGEASAVRAPASPSTQRASREAQRPDDSLRPKGSVDVPRGSSDSATGKPPSSGARSTSGPVAQGSPSMTSKATPFKDIAAMQHATQRIEAYKQSKDHFTTMDTGLSGWLAYMITTHPEHSDAADTEGLSANINTGLAGTVRQKMPPSLAKLTKVGGGTPTAAQQPYYQQYLDSASQLQSPSPNAVSSDSPSTANAGQTPVSKSPNTKGKDFLHSAGVFGGKASTGAKGLFAKGKSRFRGSTDRVE